MSASVTLVRRSIADRSTGAVRAGGALASYAFLGSWIYSGFGDDFDDILADFPDALTSAMGGGLTDTPGGYVAAVMLNVLGPFVFGVLAILWGSGAVAGEEADKTARLLFVQPISRATVVVSRAVALVMTAALGIAIFGLGLGIATTVFDNGPAVADLVATCLHLLGLSVAVGAAALAASSATGSKAAGSAAGGGLLGVSYLINSFVPLSDLEGLEQWTPWYLYNGSEPIRNGLDPVHLALLVSIALVGVVAAAVLVDRRDLEPSITPLSARVPAVGVITRPRLSTVFTKSVSGRITAVTVAVVGTIAYVMLMGLMFDGVKDSMADLTEDLPAALQSVVGSSGLGTPAGWLNSQVLSIVAPGIVLGLAVSVAADGIAGDRERGTLALILSTGQARSRVVLEQAAAVVVVVVSLAVGMAVALFAASAIGGLDLETAGILGASIQLGALGLFFGALALLLGTRLAKRTAVATTAGIAVAAFLAQAMTTSVESLDGFELLTPWQFYVGNEPLANGLSGGYVAALLGLSAVLVAGAVASFRSADAT